MTMPSPESEVTPTQELQSVLNVLKLSLKFCLNALKTGDTKEGLQKALHDDQSLPDKKSVASASETINLLHEVEQLLEPGHLVLADHFLGICASLTTNDPLTQCYRLHEHQMPLRSCGIERCRHPR